MGIVFFFVFGFSLFVIFWFWLCFCPARGRSVCFLVGLLVVSPLDVCRFCGVWFLVCSGVLLSLVSVCSLLLVFRACSGFLGCLLVVIKRMLLRLVSLF